MSRERVVSSGRLGTRHASARAGFSSSTASWFSIERTEVKYWSRVCLSAAPTEPISAWRWSVTADSTDWRSMTCGSGVKVAEFGSWKPSPNRRV